MEGQARAERKLEKAVDAMLDLLDYPDVLAAAEVSYEVQIIIDKINSVRTSVGMIT